MADTGNTEEAGSWASLVQCDETFITSSPEFRENVPDVTSKQSIFGRVLYFRLFGALYGATGNPYRKGRISTIDILVLTSSDQLPVL